MIMFIWNANGGHIVEMGRSGTPPWFRFMPYARAVVVTPHLCPARARRITTVHVHNRDPASLWT